MLPVEVRSLRKSYGKVRALNGVTFNVKEGEIYGLLGPNGAGKTTTLKILVGLLRPDSGEALIMGISVVRDRVKALKHVAYIPENPSLFQKLTVRETVHLVGALRSIPKGDVEERLERYLEIFDMKEKADEPVANLSRGMVQKVLAMTAFVVRPKVLIMDEPMVGMDPEAQHAFKEEVRRLANQGTAVIMSSHILDMVERFCTRVGILVKGKLIAEGAVEELKGKSSLEDVFLELIRDASD